MVNSKLIELLRELSSRELKDFGLYLTSPLFTNNTEYVAYFQQLQNYAPAYSSPHLAKSLLAKKWKINEKTLAYKASELLKLLEQFLAVNVYLQQPLEQQLKLMSLYDKMGLSKHYDSSRRKVQKLLDNYPYRDEQYLQYYYQWQELDNQNKQQHKRTYRESLQKAADALDELYVASKLRYNAEMINASLVLDIEYNLNLGNHLTSWMSSLNDPFAPLAKLYWKVVLMLKEPAIEAHFKELKELLKLYEKQISPTQLKELYAFLLNYCTRRINNFRDESYYQHFLDINDLLLNRDLLLEDGQIAPWRFNNLVTAGLRAERLDWVENFLQTYHKCLPEAFRENIYNFNRAHYLYWKKDYDKAQLILNQLDLRDLLLAVAAKNMLVKIYYETDQTELLISFLEAYRIYVYRQDLVKEKLRKQVRSFIDFTRKLAKLLPGDKQKKTALLNSLPPAAEILEWDWLQKMVRE